VSRLRLWKPLLTVLIAPSFKDQPGIHLRVVAIVVSLALPEPKQWLAHRDRIGDCTAVDAENSVSTKCLNQAGHRPAGPYRHHHRV
jgi:hypothetical protein